MTPTLRRARVPALAKVNLGLKVLYRRADGYHELRTVFQTISLADSVELEFTPGRCSSIEAFPEIADNLVVRAAKAVFEAARIRGALRVKLTKRIPMGAGLGGGSSDAAAVLLALPVLAGRPLPLVKLIELGGRLGSDVPFFLLGGAAVAVSRGEELYPLPDFPVRYGVLVTPDLHVSTPDAYRALQRPMCSEAGGRLTLGEKLNYINSFQALVWEAEGWPGGTPEPPGFENDFEPVVFELYPRLKSIKRKLRKLGAECAMMSGSGSAVFGLFRRREEAEEVCRTWTGDPAYSIRTVNRSQYRSLWWRSLAPHVNGKVWPLRSRYAQ